MKLGMPVLILAMPSMDWENIAKTSTYRVNLTENWAISSAKIHLQKNAEFWTNQLHFFCFFITAPIDMFAHCVFETSFFSWKLQILELVNSRSKKPKSFWELFWHKRKSPPTECTNFFSANSMFFFQPLCTTPKRFLKKKLKMQTLL